jgi:uncharacterized protein DUF6941
LSGVEVLLVALCENASMDESRRPTLHGVFSRIGMHSLPGAKERIVVAVELWGPPNENLELSLRLVGPSFSDPPTISGIDVQVGEYGFVSFGAQLDQVPLLVPGVHALEIVSDDRVLAHRRFDVVLWPSTTTSA